jgi:hypothetical protein
MSEFFKVASAGALNVALNYDKADLAVQLVNEYDSNILRNVSTIIPLSGNAYGVYMNSDNIKNMPEDMRMIFRGSMNDQQINMTPKVQLIDYLKRFQGAQGFEDFDFNGLENNIEANDTIRINVNKILSSIDSSLYQVLEIASTIVHEATHANEMEEHGTSSEAGPEAAEVSFNNSAVNSPLLNDLANEQQPQQQIASSSNLSKTSSKNSIVEDFESAVLSYKIGNSLVADVQDIKDYKEFMMNRVD